MQRIDQIRLAKSLSDELAVRYARLAMGHEASAHFEDVTIKTWKDLLGMIKIHFLPADLEQALMNELYKLRIVNNDLGLFYVEFQAYCKYLVDFGIEDRTLIAAFLHGLESASELAENRKTDHSQRGVQSVLGRSQGAKPALKTKD